MEYLRRFQNRFGSRWVKVSFYRTIPWDSRSDSLRGDRFCEAIIESYRRPLILTPHNITCPGAQYVFGWNGNLRPEMIEDFSKELAVSRDRAETMVNQLPKLKQGYGAIGLNQTGKPDVLVSYLQPEQLMEIVRAYQQKTGKDLVVRLSSVTSVCGHTALKAFLDQGINLSFGCPKARKYGKIGRDRLSVGVPLGLARLLAQS